MMSTIPEFTKEDFLDTEKPYDFIAKTAQDQSQESDLLQLVSENAKRAGIRNFRKLYADYRKFTRR